MIISGQKKALNKIQHPFLMFKKNLCKLYIENIPKLIKDIYENSRTNSILNIERLDASSPLRSEIRQGYSPLTLLFNIIPEVIFNMMMSEKETKDLKQIFYSQTT